MDLRLLSVVVHWSNGPRLRPRIRLSAAISGAPGWGASHMFSVNLRAGGVPVLGGDVPMRARPIVLVSLAGPVTSGLEAATRLEGQLFSSGRHYLPGTTLRLNRVHWRPSGVTLSLLGLATIDGEALMDFPPGHKPELILHWNTPRNNDPNVRARLEAVARGIAPLVYPYGDLVSDLVPKSLSDPPAR